MPIETRSLSLKAKAGSRSGRDGSKRCRDEFLEESQRSIATCRMLASWSPARLDDLGVVESFERTAQIAVTAEVNWGMRGDKPLPAKEQSVRPILSNW